MAVIDWKLIDDYEFVQLTADLLRGLGFVEIHIQGDGPDGGLDIIASELVPFSIQGAQPFRWGIQCKFSKTGTRRSVNDSEVRDVEGILRSSRYSSHNLRGYMLITNRRVAQNVVERLSGINLSSSFRTAYLDGAQFTHRLAGYPNLIDRYFGEIKKAVIDLGTPHILTSSGPDFLYLLDVELSSPWTDHIPVKTKAILDSGAQVSAMPISVLSTLGVRVVSQEVVIDLVGEHKMVNQYEINLRLGDAKFNLVRVLGLDMDYGFIGQDLLINTIALFDGPNRLVKIWAEGTE